MRQVTFTGPPPPTSDPMFLEWVRDRLNDLQIASAENVFEPETLEVYAPLNSPAFTGAPTAPTPAVNDNDTSIATTAFVQTELTGFLDSPVFIGNPRAPTPSPGDNDTSIATTAFVTAAISAGGFVPTSQAVNTGTGLTGGGNLTADRTIALANTTVSPGTYTNMTGTVDAQGRLTAASNGAPGLTVVQKSANQTVTSSTAFVNATDLTFAIGANEIYQFKAYLFAVTGAGGIKVAVNGPAGLVGLRTAAGSFGAFTSAYDTTISSTGSSASIMILIEGYVVNGATAGTFAIRFSQLASNISGCTVQERSWLEYRLVT